MRTTSNSSHHFNQVSQYIQNGSSVFFKNPFRSRSVNNQRFSHNNENDFSDQSILSPDTNRQYIAKSPNSTKLMRKSNNVIHSNPKQINSFSFHKMKQGQENNKSDIILNSILHSSQFKQKGTKINQSVKINTNQIKQPYLQSSFTEKNNFLESRYLWNGAKQRNAQSQGRNRSSSQTKSQFNQQNVDTLFLHSATSNYQKRPQSNIANYRRVMNDEDLFKVGKASFTLPISSIKIKQSQIKTSKFSPQRDHLIESPIKIRKCASRYEVPFSPKTNQNVISPDIQIGEESSKKGENNLEQASPKPQLDFYTRKSEIKKRLWELEEERLQMGSEEEREEEKKLPEEEKILLKCERKLSRQIEILQRNMNVAQDVQIMIKDEIQKNEEKGDKQMAEFYKNLSYKEEMNNEYPKLKLKKESKTSKNLSLLREQILNAVGLKGKKPTDDINQKIKESQNNHGNGNEMENCQQQIDQLQSEIHSALKKVEKCLDMSVEQSLEYTIDMLQIPYLSEASFKTNEIFLREESTFQKSINLMTPSKKIISVDIFYESLNKLPFNLKPILAQPLKYLVGQGAFGKVYKIQPEDKSPKPSEGLAVKMVKFNDTLDLERKATEIIIQKYLSTKQYRHMCQQRNPAYILEDQTSLQLLILQELADFSLAQVLRKRCSYLEIYNEFELLHLFKIFLIMVKEMHANKVAHRDIKPENFVFSSQTRSWKIIDFGIGKIEDDLSVCKEYSICGTRLYAIPKIQEMRFMKELRQKVKMSLKAYDIYSLGITFLRMKRVLITPFDQKILKEILASPNPFGDPIQLSSIIIAALTAKEEQARIDLDLQGLINQIDAQLFKSEIPFPNDYRFMNDLPNQFQYGQSNLNDNELFEKCLTFKKLQRFDEAHKALFTLLGKSNLSLKLSNKMNINQLNLIYFWIGANCLSSIAQVYYLQSNFFQSFIFSEQAREVYEKVYPIDSLKYGEILEQLSDVCINLNKQKEGIDFCHQSLKIYEQNTLGNPQKIMKLRKRIESSQDEKKVPLLKSIDKLQYQQFLDGTHKDLQPLIKQKTKI